MRQRLAERDLRNRELAERLTAVCAAFAVPEKTRIATRFMSSDFVMSRRIASILEPGASYNPALALEWDETIGCLDGEALALAVAAFLRGLFLGNIRSDRLAGQSLVRRIEEGKLNFPPVPDREAHAQVLADAFDWLAASGGYFDDEVETLRGFAKGLLKRG